MFLDNPEDKQAMLASIIENSEDAIISKNIESRITSWNKAAERMFGYTEQEALGQLIYIIIPHDRYAEEEMIISNLKQGSYIRHFETVRKSKKGKLIYVSITVSPITNAEGDIVGASKIARDITQQKQYEERLQLIHSIGKLISAQLDTTTILQKVTDATTLISGAAFGAFFYQKTNAKGEPDTLFTLSGITKEKFEELGIVQNESLINAVFESKKTIRSDDINQDMRHSLFASGTAAHTTDLPFVSCMAVPVVSQSGFIIGALVFGHPETGMFTYDHEALVASIASQAAIALDNAKLYEEINILNSKKDTFIGFASHELKTPLTTIKGYLQLAEAAEIPAKDILPKISKQLARLEGIIADLLDISKIQAGKLDLHFSKCELKEILKESIESVDFSNHTIELDSPSEELILYADQQKITQVLVNLLTNAVKYSAPETNITVSALIFGDDVQISVTDHGIGIPQEHLDKIFNQFYRISSDNKAPKGMGLGLYLSREIMEGHSGKIWAESTTGQGSTFYIRFPINKAKS